MSIIERARPAVSAETRGPRRRDRLRASLTQPVDSANLAFFRIGFGALMVWEAWRYVERGFIRHHYIEPPFLFTFWGFGWVEPHEVGTYAVMAVAAVAAAAVAFGLYHRLSAVVLGLCWFYIFGLDKTWYLNHAYLAGLLCFLLAVVPAHARWSLDARRKPWLRSDTVPAWTLWFLRFQVGVPYVFGGIAKLNFDWLVRAEPLREWLLSKTDFPIIGRFFPYEVTIHSMAIGATLFDLCAPFLLLNRRTRGPAYGVAIGFHFLNSRLFSIGIFPWMMIVATTVFFDPDWPQRMWSVVRSGGRKARGAIALGAVVGGFIGSTFPQGGFAGIRAFVGAFGVAVFAFLMLPARWRDTTQPDPSPATEVSPWRGHRVARPLAIFVGVWVVLQLLLPFRHFAIPGNAHWTDGGQKFAWHMMLRQKRALTDFHLTDPATGETWTENLSEHLTPHQIAFMSYQPDMIVQFAHHLEDMYQELLGKGDLEVRVTSQAWLNSREPQVFMDPDVDLTTIRGPVFLRWDIVEPLSPYR